MGFMKHQMEKEEQQRKVAESIAIEAAAIKECEYHEDVLIDRGDPSANELAYKIANSRFSKKDEIIVDLFEDRRELTNIIKQVIDAAGDECYSCSKLDEE